MDNEFNLELNNKDYSFFSNMIDSEYNSLVVVLKKGKTKIVLAYANEVIDEKTAESFGIVEVLNSENILSDYRNSIESLLSGYVFRISTAIGYSPRAYDDLFGVSSLVIKTLSIIIMLLIRKSNILVILKLLNQGYKASIENESKLSEEELKYIADNKFDINDVLESIFEVNDNNM